MSGSLPILMVITILSRRPPDILASEWSPPSLVDSTTPCISAGDSENLQYVTTPFRGSTTLSFKGSGALLNGFTWTSHGDDPNLDVRVSPDDAAVSVSQTGGGAGTCNPFTASVSGLDPSQRHTLTIVLTPEGSAAQTFFILSGSLLGAPDSVDDSPPAASSSIAQTPTSTHPPPVLSSEQPTLSATSTRSNSETSPVSSTLGSSTHAGTPNVPHSGPETGSPTRSEPSAIGPSSTAHNSSTSKRSKVALEIGVPMGIIGLLLLMALAWLILRRRQGKPSLVPYWRRASAPDAGPQSENGKRDPESPQVPQSVGTEEGDLVALNAVLDQAGLSVHELLELCARRPIADDQGSSYDDSSLPPGYASEASW